jgi:predicted oxidoreductase
METIALGVSGLQASRLAYGCWRLAGTTNPAEVTPERRAAGRRALLAALEAGYTLFDTADVYARGEVERIMGDAFKDISGLRERMVLVTKCGVRPVDTPVPGAPHRWDFSGDYIVSACEGSLRRMGIETVDVLLLHRPDYLADPDEVAAAFSRLKQAGKVRHFGVSNFRPSLVSAIQAACPMPLVVHQLEASLAKLDALTDGTLDQCLEMKMRPMAWSPLAAGLIGDGAKRLLPLQQQYKPELFLPTLETIARARGTSRTVVALAWLMKHPAGIIPIVGSTNEGRIREATQALKVELTRDEWYLLLKAAIGQPLP